MGAKNILMVVGDFVEDYEVMVPLQALQMLGHTVHSVCPDKKAAGVIEGKSCTAYPAVLPEVKGAGGRWIDTPLDKAYVDGNLVTAPAWPAKFLALSGTKIEL